MAAGPAPAGFIITMSEPWAQPTVLPEAPEERGGPRRHLAVERHGIVVEKIWRTLQESNLPSKIWSLARQPWNMSAHVIEYGICLPNQILIECGREAA